MCETCGCRPLARSRVYSFISASFSYPDAALVEFMQSRILDTENSLLFLESPSSFEAVQSLRPVVMSLSADQLDTEYVRTFGHTISKECPPYETEYGQAHIFQQSQALADISGFYRAFGLELTPEVNDRLDHLGVELEFMQFLCLKEAHAQIKASSEEPLALCREAQVKFLGEHLGQWAPGFAQRLDEKAAGSVYGLIGQLLTAFLTFELQAFELELDDLGIPDVAESPEAVDLDCEECPLVVPAAEGLGTGGAAP